MKRRQNTKTAAAPSLLWMLSASLAIVPSALAFLPATQHHISTKTNAVTTSSSASTRPLQVLQRQQKQEYPRNADQRSSYPRGPLCLSSNDNNNNDDENEATSSFLERLGNPFGLSSTTTAVSSNENKMATSDNSVDKSSTTLPPGLVAIQTALEPLQLVMDDASADWMLSYADLRPESSGTLLGQAFLATNVLYALAGLVLTLQGDLWFGLTTEITSVASFAYHYTQLEARGEDKAATVRLALTCDYICAVTSLTTATAYWLGLPHPLEQMDIFVTVGLSFAFLGLSWVYESVKPYVLFHSLWHIFGAYAGYLIGVAHNGNAGSSNLFS